MLILSLLVVLEVVEYGRGVSVGVKDLEHLFALLEGNLLSVARVGHRLVVVVLQLDAAQVLIGHVLHVDPLDLKAAAPLVLRPHIGALVVVHARHHLGHATKVTRAVHREEQVDGHLAVHLMRLIVVVVSGELWRRALHECRVEASIAVLGGAPDVVLDAAVHVVLRVALDDEEASGARRQVELGRIVVVRI